MDDITRALEALFWKYWDLILEKAAETITAVLVGLTRLLYAASERFERLLAHLSTLSGLELSLWTLAGLALAALILFRQRVYDRWLVYNIHWLRFQGYGRVRFRVRRGLGERRVDIMGRAVPLPARFDGLAVYEALPDRYVVAYGLGRGGRAHDLRSYPRVGRAGYEAMRRDLTEHLRRESRFINPRVEIEALMAFLAAADERFAPPSRSSRDPFPPVDERMPL